MANRATRLLLNDAAFLVDLTGGASGPTSLESRQSTFGGARPFAASYGSSSAALAGGLTVFAGTNAADGTELWATDGTVGGTRLVAALTPGLSTQLFTSDTAANTLVTVGGSVPAGFVALDAAHALFTAMDGDKVRRLWITDGTAAGTAQLSRSVSLNGSLTALRNGRALFSGYEAGSGSEPWVTDGTAAGTRLIADLVPGYGLVGRNA